MAWKAHIRTRKLVLLTKKMFFLFLIGVTSGRFVPHAEINIYPNEGEKIETKLRITVRSNQRKDIELIIN